MTQPSLEQLAVLLKETLDPSARQKAEATLIQMEKQPQFVVMLLQLVQQEKMDPNIRFAGALLFKNTIKKLWAEAPERTVIKQNLVELMISVPEKYQLQISDAVSLIAYHDFPHEWPDLIPVLVSKFHPTDYRINLGVLMTAHSIFRRYRHAVRCDDLFQEINNVLAVFCEPYKQLFVNTDNLIQQGKSDVKLLFQCLLTMCKIYFSLNYQDIPAYFEDHLSTFMPLLVKYLAYHNPAVEGDEDEAGLLEKVKTCICEIVDIYAKKYEEVFHPYLPQFVEQVWQMLGGLGLEQKYDQLVSTGITFLASVAKHARHKSMFEAPGALRAFCEKIILPNCQLRQSEEELFEDDPIEYIRRDLEGSDADTRRHAGTVLIRSLLEQFEKEITEIAGGFIQAFLQQYAANPAQNWKDKDTAIYLMISISATAATAQLGATKTNANINVPEIFSSQILPDLQSSQNVHPVLLVDALKFLTIFRHHLPPDQLSLVFPLIVEHLKHPNYVAHTYACVALERVLVMKTTVADKSQYLLSANDLKPLLPALLQNLFQIIESKQSAEKVSENDYLVKTLMRVIFIAKTEMMPFANTVIEKLTRVLEIISRNPSNPRFNHYVFESIGCLIRFLCAANKELVSEFEKMLFSPLQAILASDIPEFTPYVLQILAQLLEFHRGQTSIPEAYKPLLPPLLLPALWELNGNIPALVRLLQAYLHLGAREIVANQQLPAFLGIFQKLISSRANDTFGFELLMTIYESVDDASLATFEKQIFNIFLLRLQSSKTQKFVLSFLNFICSIVCLKPAMAEKIVVIFDSMQPQLFQMVFTKVLLPASSKEAVASPLKRKIMCVGLIKLLSAAKTSMNAPQAIAPMIAEVGRLLQQPLTVKPGEEHAEEEEEINFTNDPEEAGYQSAFVRLYSIAKENRDYAADVADVAAFFKNCIQAAVAAHPQQFSAAASQLPADTKTQFAQMGIAM